MKTRSLVALLTLLFVTSQASAHFIWVAIDKDISGLPGAFVWFSELAEPDSADLLDKITTVQVWSRTHDGKSANVTVTKQTKGEGGALVGKVPDGVAALSATINYGVLTRGEQSFQLQYHAKYLDASVPAFKALARDEALVFDIVPHAAGKDISLEVLFQGKPVADAEVVIYDPTSKETKAKTDASGRIPLPPSTRGGLYSIRAKWVVIQPGKVGDKEFPQTNHYSTLALRVQ